MCALVNFGLDDAFVLWLLTLLEHFAASYVI